MEQNAFLYDGLLQKPFLAEHWHKGLAAAFASWLPSFWLVTWLYDESLILGIWIASLISTIILIAALTYYQGFSLDKNSLKFRVYTWVLGIRFGTWQPLPVITHITLRPHDRKHFLPMSDVSVRTGFIATEHKWQVLLNVADSPTGIIVAYVNESKAKQVASTLGSLLELKILIL